jgi:mitochondrial fission protein ELM1
MITLNRANTIVLEMHNESEILPYLNKATKLIIQDDITKLTHAALQSGVPFYIKTLDTGRQYRFAYVGEELTIIE